MLAAVVALVLCGAAGCTGTEPEPTPTRTFDGYPVLEPWTEAMLGADSDAATIVVLGDSVSEGFGVQGELQHRWVDRLQRSLRARVGTPDCPRGIAGFHGSTSVIPADYRARTLPDPATSGEVLPQYQVGPGGRSLQLTPGASVTWQVHARSVDVGYRTRPGGGTLRVEIDGITPPDGLAVRTHATPEGERRVWSSGDLGPGRHTVTVVNSSDLSGGAPVTVTDLTPFRGDRDRCVHVLDASRSGVSARTISRTPTYLADSLSLDPDLLVVPLGFNDAQRGVGPAEFGRVLDSLIEQTRGLGYEGPVLLVGWFVPDWGERPQWSRYLAQMEERTRHDAVSFIDLSAVLPPVASAPDGVYMDALHPGPKGQRLIAESLLEALAPRSDLEGTNAGELG